MRYTKHGAIRGQQRSIPKLVANWLFEYGRSVRVRGADKYYFDKASRRQLEQEVGRQIVRLMSRYLDTYIVVADDGKVITQGWRTHRIKA